MSTATGVRICACGCGIPVRRRWVVGHDGRYMGELLRDWREARTETERSEVDMYAHLAFSSRGYDHFRWLTAQQG